MSPRTRTEDHELIVPLLFRINLFLIRAIMRRYRRWQMMIILIRTQYYENKLVGTRVNEGERARGDPQVTQSIVPSTQLASFLVNQYFLLE